MKPEDKWIWGAGGKHPVAKDYIALGQETQVMKALSRWMEEGFSRVGNTSLQHSWRFFTKGLKSEELACGLLRDSRDGAGRPFPFLIMGYGRIDKWEQHWELLPYAFDDVWERMEFMSVKRFFDLEDLKGNISRLPSPVLDGRQPSAGEPDKTLMELPQQSDTISLALNSADDYTEEVVCRLKRIKGHYSSIPSAVFIGGTQDKVMLTAFMRSLNTNDFEKLWTTC